MRRFAKRLYVIGDKLRQSRVDSILVGGASAFDGTNLQTGLATYAHEQHGRVQKHSEFFDGAGVKVAAAADDFERQDDNAASSFGSIYRD